MQNKLSRWIVSALLVAATVGLFVYGALVGASSVAPPDGGVQGRVWIGPVSPVQKVGELNEKAYPDVTILVKDEAGRTVARVVSDANGDYSVALPHGTYVLDPQSPDGSALPRAGAITVTVAAGPYSTVDIHYDSGIR